MKNNRPKDRLLLLTSFIFVAYAVMPIVSYLVPSVIRVALLLVLALALIKDGGIKSFWQNLGRLIPVYLITVLDIIYLFAQNPMDAVNSIYDIGCTLMISMLYLHVLFNKRDNIVKPLLWIIVITYGITIATTIYGNIIFPGASRELATGMPGNEALYNIYRTMNIGGFLVVYCTVLPTVILPYIFKSRAIPRVFTLLIFLLILFFAYQTQYTTALLVCLSSAMFFFARKNLYPKDVIRYLLFFSVIAVFLWELLPGILFALSELLDNPIFAERLNDIAGILSGDDNTGEDLKERQDVYEMGINAFLDNPIIGSGKRVGGHSFVLDALSEFGLVGLIMLLVMIKKIYDLYAMPFKKEPFFGYLLFGLCMYCFLILVNPSPLYLGVTFLLPLISYSLKKSKSSI